ncbi:MAG: HlyD family efflux transporter periplasmic adaptor subunit, partial [Pirellulales bacterium]|nr:HlyD family efflux transporter periplasmic adaptor subunit [Pirellulales bacterium]
LVEANLDKARLNLARTQITAPVDGVVVQDLVEADGYVAPGTVVVRIEDVSQCDVRCNLRMDELDWIWRQPARAAAVEHEPGSAAHDYSLPPTPTTVIYRLGDRRYEWDGVLTRYDGIGLDETTRTVPCIIVVEEPTRVREAGADASGVSRGPRALVRGMYVDLVIHAQPHLSLLEVPEQAIQPGNKVLRVQDGKLNIIPVQVVSVMNGRAVIRVKQRAPLHGEKDKQLRPGDQVVITPPSDIEEDMPVRVESEGGR